MDSNEFARRHAVEQRGMVERGEVMAELMFVPTPGLQSGCFWCGDTVDILLFGRARGESNKSFKARVITAEAPHEAVNHKSCEGCAERMSRGVCLFEINAGQRPTGRYWVLSESCIRKIVKFDTLADEIITRGKGWVDRETARRVGLYDVEPVERIGD